MSYRKYQKCVCGYVYLAPYTEDKTNPKGLGDEEFTIVIYQDETPHIVACPKCGTLKLDI